MNGAAANDVLIGGAGQDCLVVMIVGITYLAKLAMNTMTGGDGRDTFVFTPRSNNDTIKDFAVSEDLLRYNLATFQFADLNLSDNGGDLHIATSGGDSVTLLGLAGTLMTEADFLIVA